MVKEVWCYSQEGVVIRSRRCGDMVKEVWFVQL